MRVKLHVDPRAATLAGKNEAGLIEIDVNPAELTSPQRQELAKSDIVSEMFILDHPGRRSGGGPSEATMETVQDTLDALVARRQKRHAEKTRKLDQEIVWLTDLKTQDNECFTWRDGLTQCQVRLSNRVEQIKLLAAELRDSEVLQYITEQVEVKLPALQAAATRAKNEKIAMEQEQEHETRLEKIEAIRTAEEEEREKAEWLENFIRDGGSADQKERLAAGVLDPAEMFQTLEDYLFRGFIGMDIFSEIGKEELLVVCVKNLCSGMKMEEKKEKVKAYLTAEEFAGVKILQKKAEPTQIQVVAVSLRCANCGAEVSRTAYRVTIFCGPFSLSRDFAVYKHSAPRGQRREKWTEQKESVA